MGGLTDLLSIGCGFKARAVCGGVFASALERRRIEREEAGFNPLFALMSARVDPAARSVVSSVLGTTARKAVFVEGMGAVLPTGVPEEEIASWRMPAPAAASAGARFPAWPDAGTAPGVHHVSGLDVERIAAAAERLFSDGGRRKLRTRALLMIHDGRLAYERYAPGIGPETRLPSWSMAKSVTGCLVGILAAQGRLDIAAPAAVPEWSGAGDPRRAITLEHLLRMSSGLEWGEVYARQPVSDVNRMLFLERDMAAYAASKPPVAVPGTAWSYSSGTTNIVCRILRGASPTREDAWDLPRRLLFDRIGMSSALFAADASGTLVGSSYLYATARDFARFGLLCLREGTWEGERVLPEGWMHYATTPAPAAPRGEYGAFFWLNRGSPAGSQNRMFPRLPPDAFFAMGFQGQSVAVLPSQGTVVVRLGVTHSGEWGLEDFLSTAVGAVRGAGRGRVSS